LRLIHVLKCEQDNALGRFTFESYGPCAAREDSNAAILSHFCTGREIFLRVTGLVHHIDLSDDVGGRLSLRADGLVSTRRDGKIIYYSLASDEARTIIGAIYDVFCKKPHRR
jgi:DNA-binding transcriptional ArsR family regulator